MSADDAVGDSYFIVGLMLKELKATYLNGLRIDSIQMLHVVAAINAFST
jgi:hypothetical protein